MEDPVIQIPPDAELRNFNENDILGDFDRDKKGRIILKRDKKDYFVDKVGRRVNEKGYLIDPKNGDIVNNALRNKMFDNSEINEKGELPAPFCLEKYNFNPHNIMGAFNYYPEAPEGKPQIFKNKKGELYDYYGRKVNEKGYLIDDEGNIIDKHGRKKFDKQ